MPVTAFPHHEAANRAQILRSRSQALTKSRKCGSVLCHTDVPSICAKRVFLAFAQRAPIELLVPPSDRGYRLRAWFTGSFVTCRPRPRKLRLGYLSGVGSSVPWRRPVPLGISKCQKRRSDSYLNLDCPWQLARLSSSTTYKRRT